MLREPEEIGKKQCDPDADEKAKEDNKLTVFDTSLALIAGTIGGEIVAIPYAFHHLGLILSIGTLITVAFTSHISNMMYL